MLFKDNQAQGLIVFWEGGGRAQRRLSVERSGCLYAIRYWLFVSIDKTSLDSKCSDEERST